MIVYIATLNIINVYSALNYLKQYYYNLQTKLRPAIYDFDFYLLSNYPHLNFNFNLFSLLHMHSEAL